MTTISKVGQLVYLGKGSGGLWVTPDQLRAALRAEGFDALADKVTELDPLRRARESASFRIGWVVKTPCKIEVLSPPPLPAGQEKKKPTDVRFSVQLREADDQRADWLQREVISYDLATGWSTPQTEVGKEFVRVASALWQVAYNYGHVRSEIVFPTLQRGGAFSVGNGGMYFTEDAGLVERLRRVVETCRDHGASPDNTGRLCTIAVTTADPDGVASVAVSAEEMLSELVAGATSKLEEWRGKARARTSTLESLMEELLAARERALGLGRALSFSTAAVEAELAAVQAQVQATLDEVWARDPAPAAAPTPAPVVPDPVAYVQGVKAEQAEQAAAFFAAEQAGPGEELPSEPGSEVELDPVAPAIPSPDELEGMSTKELLKLCKALGIPGASKLKSNAARISALNQARESVC